MKTANFTEFRQNLRAYLDRVINDTDTVVINRGNGTAAVLISMDEYNASLKQKDGETVEDFLARI